MVDSAAFPPAIDPLERRRIGSTALTVTRLGVGGGSSFTRAGDDLLDACWDAGLRHFDTSPLYASGDSERRFGKALAGRPRAEFVLSTKVGRLGERAFGYSAADVRASLERSLERLGLDRVDMVMIHDVDPDLHGENFERCFALAMGETYPVLERLRAQGAIGAVGVGVKNWDVCLRFARAGNFDCFMLAGGYTLLQHGSLAEFLAHCAAHRISVMVAAPYNTGILATGSIEGARYYYQPAPPEILARVRALEVVCARHDTPLAAAALQFPLHHPAVASVVVGHSHAEEVHRNLALLRRPIPPALWVELKQAGLIPAAAPTPR